MNTVNPDIRKILIGKKTLTEYEIYPLSISDQKRVTNILVEAYKAFSGRIQSVTDESQEEVINIVVGSLSEDIPKIMALVFDTPFEEASSIFDSMTNPQFSEFVDAVWDVNYKSLEKNESGLFQMIQKMLKKGQKEQAIEKIKMLRQKR